MALGFVEQVAYVTIEIKGTSGKDYNTLPDPQGLANALETAIAAADVSTLLPGADYQRGKVQVSVAPGVHSASAGTVVAE